MNFEVFVVVFVVAVLGFVVLFASTQTLCIMYLVKKRRNKSYPPSYCTVCGELSTTDGAWAVAVP
jgi:hypothetical protein